MKLASLKSGRDGRLVVVSDDLAYYADAGHIVATLQGALDDWERHEPALRNLATDLEHGSIPRERFTSARRRRHCPARISGPTDRLM